MRGARATMPLLVGFLACHLSSVDQIEELRLCLASVQVQTAMRALLVSYSAASVTLAEQAGRVLEAAARECEYVHALPQPEPHSQFEHFDACRAYAERELIGEQQYPRDSIWCIFSDDDDIWHADRSRVYTMALRQATRSRQLAEAQAVLCSTFATETVGMADYEAAWRARDAGQPLVSPRQSPCTAAEVAQWLSDGRARLADAHTKNADGSARHELCEYWCVRRNGPSVPKRHAPCAPFTDPLVSPSRQYCTRFSTLCSFLEDATDSLKRSRFCDMAFRAHIRQYGGGGVLDAPAPAGCWVYFHSKRKALAGTSMSQSAGPPQAADDGGAGAPEVEALLRLFPEGSTSAEEVWRSLTYARRHAELSWASAYQGQIGHASPAADDAVTRDAVNALVKRLVSTFDEYLASCAPLSGQRSALLDAASEHHPSNHAVASPARQLSPHPARAASGSFAAECVVPWRAQCGRLSAQHE